MTRRPADAADAADAAKRENAQMVELAATALAAGASPTGAVDYVHETTSGQYPRTRILLAVSKVYRADRRWCVAAHRAELAELVALEAEVVAASGLRATPACATDPSVVRSAIAETLGIPPPTPALERELADLAAERGRAVMITIVAVAKGLGPLDALLMVHGVAAERAQAGAPPISDRVVLAVVLESFRNRRHQLPAAHLAELATIDDVIVDLADRVVVDLLGIVRSATVN